MELRAVAERLILLAGGLASVGSAVRDRTCLDLQLLLNLLVQIVESVLIVLLKILVRLGEAWTEVRHEGWLARGGADLDATFGLGGLVVREG